MNSQINFSWKLKKERNLLLKKDPVQESSPQKPEKIVEE
jgi:hypothetical protein